MTEATQPRALPSASGHRHACLAYETERGFRAVAAPFVLAGLRAGERVVCLLHDHEAEELLDALRERSGGEVDVDRCLDAGQLASVAARDHYAPGGTFDPEDVVRRVSELHDRTLEAGWEGLRVMGETGWLAEHDGEFDAWVRYEWLIEEQLPERLTALCVYPAATLEEDALETAMEPHELRYIDLPVSDSHAPREDGGVIRRWSGELGEEGLRVLLSETLTVVDEAVFVVSEPGAGRRPDLAVSVVRDVSEREARREELEHQRERLHQLMGRLLEVQESERRHVARELHDEVGGQLTAVGRSLDALAPLLDEDEAGDRLAEARERVEEAMERLRGLMESLRPAVLDDLGLVPALRSEVRRRSGPEGLDCRFEADAESYGLRPEVESACFRVVQEALTNVLRHAAADRVEIELRRLDGRLVLTVRDDGAGFRLNQKRDGAREAASLGLLGMRERADAVGGELQIESAPGEGTRLRLVVPTAEER